MIKTMDKVRDKKTGFTGIVVGNDHYTIAVWNRKLDKELKFKKWELELIEGGN